MDKDQLVIEVAKKIVSDSGILGVDIQELEHLGDVDHVHSIVSELISVFPTPFYLLKNESAQRVFYDNRVGVAVDDVIREVVYGKTQSSAAAEKTILDRVFSIVEREKEITEGVVVNKLRRFPRDQVTTALEMLVNEGRVSKINRTLRNGKTCDFYCIF